MKLKKRIGIVLTTLLAVLLAFAFAACANETGEGGSTNCKHAHYSLLSDANQHWEECDECGNKRNAEAHYDNDHDGKCDKEGCGATVSGGGGGETCQHPADQVTFVEIPGNDNEHTKHCNACNTDIGTEYHVYPLSDGDSVCSKCNHTCAHSDTAWQAGKSTHYKSCVYCYKQLTQPEAHQMVGGECGTCGITQAEIDEFPDENASDFGICGNGQGKLLVGDNYSAEDRKLLSKDVTWDGEGEKSTISGDFYAGDRFKVTDGGSWYGYEKVNEGKSYVTGVDDGYGGKNIEFTQNGNYTITFYSSPVKIDLTRNGDVGDITETKRFYLVGSFNAAETQMWNTGIRDHLFVYDASIKMWKVDVTVTANDIPPASWNDGKDPGYTAGAAKIDILDADNPKNTLNLAVWVVPGNYTFYYNQLTLGYTAQGEPAPQLGKWFLTGKGTGATFAGKTEFGQLAEHAFTSSTEGVYVYTATFAVGDQFKVRSGATWLGYSAMTADASLRFTENTDDGNIVVGIAGTYLITLTESTQKFTITTSEPAHQHNIDSDNWTKDVTGHWHACDSCSEKFDFSEHTYDDTECTTCGFPKPTTDPTDDADTRAWYILGKGKGSLKGNNWNHNSNVTLTKGEGNVFTATVTLYAGDEFKLAYGGAWEQDQDHPNVGSLGKSAVWTGADLFDGTDNLVVKEDGEYTITLYTFITNKDSELKQDHFDVVKTATVVDPKPENYAMYLVGTINEEDPNTWTDNFTADTKLTSDGHGVWTITFTVTERMYVTTWGAEQNGSAYIKVKNDVYGEDYGASGGNVKLSAGTYVITFKESDGSVTAVASHDHTWEEEWSHDENTHWHACTQEGCTERNDESEHTFVEGECVCGEKEQVEVALDERTYYLVGNSASGTLKNSNWTLGTATAAVKFTRAADKNEFTLNNITLYEGDEMQLAFGDDWGDKKPGSATDYANHNYAFGSYFFEKDNAGLFVKTDTAWDSNAKVAEGKSGVYNIVLTTSGANKKTDARAEGQIVSLKFTLVESIEVGAKTVEYRVTGGMTTPTWTPEKGVLMTTQDGDTYTCEITVKTTASGGSEYKVTTVTWADGKVVSQDWDSITPQNRNTGSTGTFRITYVKSTGTVTHTKIS